MQIVLVTPAQFGRLWAIMSPQHRLQAEGFPGATLKLSPHGVDTVIVSDDFGQAKMWRYPREVEITLTDLVERIAQEASCPDFEFRDAERVTGG